MTPLVSRREVLRLALAGLALAGCTAGPTAPAATAPTAAAGNTAPGAGPNWDSLVAAAQKEGKVVVSGPPAPDARTKLPAAFKARFGIDMEYLGGNTSQLTSRIESERAAGQYTMDASIGGADTVYGTFVPNKWLDPIKPELILPEVLDPKVWPTGGPWFRDPSGATSMQVFNTVSPFGYMNTSNLAPEELKSSDDLLKPKWQGRMAAYDPSVNGGGLVFGSVLYVIRGADFVKQLFVGQQVAYTRDYQQLADWVAHDNYSIVMGTMPVYIAPYKSAAPLQQIILSDIKTIVSGGFGIVSLWNQAPHPNAARVFVNWIASREGVSTYGAIDLSAPVRTDVDASAWLDKDLIPKPGGDYFDTYDYKYVIEQRQPIAKYYASLKGA